jgi:predicted dehydrogenase
MAMTKPVRYALIGATGIGGYHLAAIREMEKQRRVKLVAVADPALARLPDLLAELTAQGASAHLDYREMLRLVSALDVVVISVPIPLHLEMRLACLKRDVFIYLEKPPVPLIQQLETMIAADQRQRIGVGFQMIEARWVHILKHVIKAKRLGRVKRLEHIRIAACWPRLDNYYVRNTAAGKMSVRGEPVFDGPATNALAHLIHNAMFLAGAQADEFDAPVEITAELYRARPIESYDVACLRGRFRSGITFTAALTHATEETLPYLTEVRGAKGWARVSQDGTVFESSFPWPVDCRETFEQLVAKTHHQFLAFVLGQRPRPSTSLLDTRGYVLATNGMLLSSGGIHPIEAKYLRQYTRGEEGGYDVASLYDAVTASCQTGKLFSELGLPWAVKTSPVSVENLKTLAFPG